MTTTREDRDLLRIIIHGVSAFEILRTALEFDVFEKIEAAGGLDNAGLAKAIGTETQPVRVLTQCLGALDLLQKDGDKYVNAPITKEKLLRASPKYLVPLIDIQAKIINQAMVDMAESMRKNTNVGLRQIKGPGDQLYQRLSSTPDLQKVFYDNMGDASRKTFKFVAERYDFTKHKHVIDVGGGDGSNTIALLKKFPHLHATIFDQPTVCEIAKKHADREGVGDRYHTHPGDFFTTPMPKGIDCILFFHIFEIWSLPKNTALLKRLGEGLEPGGKCLVYNFVGNDEGTGPLTPAFMSAYFLTLASGEGMCYSAADMEESLRGAGYADVQRYADMPYHHALVVGTKAG